jgi:phenylalanyl-tRNA synthetase beta subunit
LDVVTTMLSGRDGLIAGLIRNEAPTEVEATWEVHPGRVLCQVRLLLNETVADKVRSAVSTAIRDLAIVVDQKLELQPLMDGMAAHRPAIIQDIRLFDVYTGKGIAAGEKSLAFRIVMQDTQKTLQDAEVDAAVQQLMSYLQHAFAAQLRV